MRYLEGDRQDWQPCLVFAAAVAGSPFGSGRSYRSLIRRARSIRRAPGCIDATVMPVVTRRCRTICSETHAAEARRDAAAVDRAEAVFRSTRFASTSFAGKPGRRDRIGGSSWLRSPALSWRDRYLEHRSRDHDIYCHRTADTGQWRYSLPRTPTDCRLPAGQSGWWIGGATASISIASARGVDRRTIGRCRRSGGPLRCRGHAAASDRDDHERASRVSVGAATAAWPAPWTGDDRRKPPTFSCLQCQPLPEDACAPSGSRSASRSMG